MGKMKELWQRQQEDIKRDIDICPTCNGIKEYNNICSCYEELYLKEFIIRNYV